VQISIQLDVVSSGLGSCRNNDAGRFARVRKIYYSRRCREERPYF